MSWKIYSCVLTQIAQRTQLQMNGMLECSICHSKVAVPSPRSVLRAYDKRRGKISSKYRVVNVLLVSGECILVGLQPILVFMSKVDGKFQFSPIRVSIEMPLVLFKPLVRRDVAGRLILVYVR